MTPMNHGFQIPSMAQPDKPTPQHADIDRVWNLQVLLVLVTGSGSS